MNSIHIVRYSRCKWMAIISAIFAAMTIGFLIPGAIGVAGANRYNDTLLYLALIDFILALVFFTGWWSCQLEVDDFETLKKKTAKRRKRNPSVASIISTTSVDSASTHQLLTRGISCKQNP